MVGPDELKPGQGISLELLDKRARFADAGVDQSLAGRTHFLTLQGGFVTVLEQEQLADGPQRAVTSTLGAITFVTSRSSRQARAARSAAVARIACQPTGNHADCQREQERRRPAIALTPADRPARHRDGSRARIVRSSRKRRKSSARADAVGYRRAGSRAIALWMIVSRFAECRELACPAPPGLYGAFRRSARNGRCAA